MSDAVRCPKCGYVYWTSCYQNWATCDNCGNDNDQIPYEAEIQPLLVDSKHIFQFIPYEPKPELKPFNRYTALMEDNDGE